MSTEPHVTIFATLIPNADQVENTRQVLRDLAAASRQEPGCLRYDVFQGEREGQATFHVIERYQDRVALQAHRASQHLLALKKQAPQLLARPLEIILLQDMDVASEQARQ